MNRVFALFLLLAFDQSHSVFAHKGNETMFVIRCDSVLHINAEFPWTLRNALLIEYPHLDSSKSKEEFNEALFNYLASHIQIDSRSLDENPLLKLEQLDSDHGDSEGYLLSYAHCDFTSITNRVLEEIDMDYSNHHLLLNGSESWEFVTSPKANQWKRKYKPSFPNNSRLWIFVATLGLMIFLFFMRRKIRSRDA